MSLITTTSLIVMVSSWIYASNAEHPVKLDEWSNIKNWAESNLSAGSKNSSENIDPVGEHKVNEASEGSNSVNKLDGLLSERSKLNEAETKEDHKALLNKIDSFTKSSEFQTNQKYTLIFKPIIAVFKKMDTVLHEFATHVTDASKTLEMLDQRRKDTLESFYNNLKDVSNIRKDSSNKTGDGDIHRDSTLREIIGAIRNKFDANIEIIKKYVILCLERKARYDGALLVFEAVKLELGKLLLKLGDKLPLRDNSDISLDGIYLHISRLKDDMERDKLLLMKEVEKKKEKIYEGIAEIVNKWRDRNSTNNLRATDESINVRNMAKKIINMNEGVLEYDFKSAGASNFFGQCKEDIEKALVGVSEYFVQRTDEHTKEYIEEAKRKIFKDATPENDKRIEKVEKQEPIITNITMPEEGVAENGGCGKGMVPAYDSSISSIPAPCVKVDVPVAARHGG
ncbi:hypothetical protein BdWA1_003382 [Babesia duncani]|uniref:Uncharacterized protein n=1 Tax=Babesia duncani TaxID=323732 RepID=A0AAD9PHR3_9APIC|nr:hypothetical protein BdWA1_003382 [Babesia duncani]